LVVVLVLTFADQRCPLLRFALFFPASYHHHHLHPLSLYQLHNTTKFEFKSAALVLTRSLAH
jgi:hypothetical protein